jgi:hypothetical protein
MRAKSLLLLLLLLRIQECVLFRFTFCLGKKIRLRHIDSTL